MPLAMLTGGASFFARETARVLIAEGWKVALSDIDVDTMRKHAAEIGGDDVISTDRLDITDLAAVKAYVDGLVEKHGGIEALVNIAGGAKNLKIGRPTFVDTDPELWGRFLGPNMYSVLNTCHTVAPHMIAARRGGIVNIASGAGKRGKGGLALYSLAKGGVVRFTEALCLELAQYGIRVNSIAPGSAESRWTPELQPASGEGVPPLGSRTSASDVANAIQFLLSDRARQITGICLDVSGGRLY